MLAWAVVVILLLAGVGTAWILSEKLALTRAEVEHQHRRALKA